MIIIKRTFETYYPNSYTQVSVIPFDDIEKLDFAQCAQPAETLGSFYERQEVKPDVLINGGLFTMKTGINVMSFIDEGKEQNYQNGFEGIGIKTSSEAQLSFGKDKDGDWRDFMSAYPVLIKNGVATTSSEWGNAASLNYAASRTAIGYSDDSLIIVTVDAPGMKFDALQKIFMSYDAKYAINLDGGGSTRKLVDGVIVNSPSENRAVDNVFAVYMKDEEVQDITPAFYKVCVNTSLNVREVPGGTILGTLSNGDIIRVDGAINGWLRTTYNGQVGFVSAEYVAFEYNEEQADESEKNDETETVVDDFEEALKELSAAGIGADKIFAAFKNAVISAAANIKDEQK